MTNFLIAGALLAVAALHLVPALGALSERRLVALYGAADDEAVALLLRHRAVLFGLLAAALALGALVPAYRLVAIAAGSVSTGSFILLAWASHKPLPPHIARIVWADVAALGGLAVAALLHALG